MDYRDQIDPLSGYVHHLLYSILCVHLLHVQMCNAFAHFLILEAPTSILALGSVFPRCRQDHLFGFLFFTTRVALHPALLIRYALTMPCVPGSTPILAFGGPGLAAACVLVQRVGS